MEMFLKEDKHFHFRMRLVVYSGSLKLDFFV